MVTKLLMTGVLSSMLLFIIGVLIADANPPEWFALLWMILFVGSIAIFIVSLFLIIWI